MNEKPHSNEAAHVLAQRAAHLARARAAQPDDSIEVFEFEVAGQPCALELAWMREVRPLRGAAMLPHTAPGVFGVVHVRGSMLPLVDLAPRLGLPASGLPEHGRLVVMGVKKPTFAFAATTVHGLTRISLSQCQRRSAALAQVRPDTVRGLTPSGRLLLDGAALLDPFKKKS